MATGSRHSLPGRRWLAATPVFHFASIDHAILKGLLSRRRKRRYAECRGQWEAAYGAGHIDARTLQAGYAGALAITLHADAENWRREQLRRVPVAPALSGL
jgi:hypothetical protein